MAQVDMVAKDIYRISAYVPHKHLTFNQFLIADDRPALIHTGTFPMYDEIRAAIAEVLDPARLAYIVVPHFEADECGGMGRFIAEAPGAVLACSALGARINLSQWDYAGPVQGMADGERIALGAHTLRFLETPHVHHWDSLMVVDEATGSLFPADLFLQPEDQPAVVREDLGGEMCAWYREAGIFAAEGPVLRVVDRVERLAPRWIHPMHGGSLPEAIIPQYVERLRHEPIAFDGRLFGRMLPE